MNKLYCGDNLQIMKKMEENSIDLIYLDPPFFSGQNYEVIWNDGTESRSFQDTEWYKVLCPECERTVVKAEKFCPDCGHDLNDAKIVRKNDIEAYIDWMKPRLQEMHRVLKDTGSIYLHVDWHAVHYLKVEMDKIFGMKNFKDNIVWSYNTRTMASNWFARKHDDILFYTKSDKYTFNPDDVRVPLSENSIKQYNKIDDEGRKYKQQSNNQRTYLNDKGQNCGDVWDIQILGSRDKERLGYPTQKPEALLDRIIKASSNPGDIIFDPFCGCGTSAAVAKKLDRQYVGIDISPTSCRLIADRVKYNELDIIGMPHTTEEYHNMEPNEFQNMVCNIMHAKNTSDKTKGSSTGRDGGIDGIIKDQDFDTVGFEGCPIQVKRSKNVGVDTVKKLQSTMFLKNKKIGFVVALSFGKGAENIVKEFKEIGYTIYLINADDLNDFNFKNYVDKHNIK